jgi:YidC/Oxa1 family membrane protein insertase
MQNVLARNINSIGINWKQLIPQQEKGRSFEERYSQLQYMLVGGDIEELSASSDDSETESARVRWIGYKDQFFSTVLIANDAFTSSEFASYIQSKNSGYIKQYNTETYTTFDVTGKDTTSMQFYFGPNHYHTLKSYNDGVDKDERLNLHKLVPLGWKIVSWINTILVIPMFDLFTNWGLHIGIVILLMTLVIKLIILPFVFMSYKSSAKMRVLKPQIDAINEKYPPEKMQERQAATMQLYRQAGVNPMSGCLPMLFQFPVLMAMFWFLPTAIELRGKSLFWAEDLSTYDAVIQFGFNIPLLGDHLSLFCLLMTIVNIIYTYINMQSQATDPNMKFMKYMMYSMPVIFLFIFNDYAAGLSYYYLVSLFITILQTMIFRWTLNDKKLLAEIEKTKKHKAGKPKSGFMKRLEEMQREQQRLAREQAKANMRR